MKTCPCCGKCFPDDDEACAADGGRLAEVFPGPPVIEGKYLLEKRLGAGGMGEVFLARHIELQKRFAVKLIRSEKARREEHLARFRQEARALGRLEHPNIVRVTDYGVDRERGNLPYLVMEYLEGQPLSELLGQAPFAWPQARPVLAALAAALDYAHENGIVHRDLKPSNIFLIRADGEPGGLKVLDFGLARLLEDDPGPVPGGRLAGSGPPRAEERPGGAGAQAETVSLQTTLPAGLARAPRPAAPPAGLTATGDFLGTPQYLAPESVGGRAGKPADIYAFGLVAFELLTGRPVFQGNSTIQFIAQHLQNTPPNPSEVLPSLPPAADAPLLQALEKEPEDRPARAADIVGALDAAFRDQARLRWRKREFPRRFRLAAVLAALASALYVVVAGLSPFLLLDARFFDWTGSLRSPRPLDERIVLTLVPEGFWSREGEADVDRFSAVLQGALQAGVRGVACDLILPARFAPNPSFNRLVLEHRERLAFAAITLPGGAVRGPECLGAPVLAVLGAEDAGRLFRFVNIAEDPDGVVRRYAVAHRDTRGRLQPSLGLTAAGMLQGGEPDPGRGDASLTLDFARAWPDRVLPWSEVQRRLAERPSWFRGKLLLVGGSSEFADDMFQVPPAAGLPVDVPGLVVHALAVDELLRGGGIRTAGPWAAAALVLLLSFPAAAGVLALRPAGWAAAGACLPALVLFLAVSGLDLGAQFRLPLTAPLACLAVAALAALWGRRRLPAFP